MTEIIILINGWWKNIRLFTQYQVAGTNLGTFWQAGLVLDKYAKPSRAKPLQAKHERLGFRLGLLRALLFGQGFKRTGHGAGEVLVLVGHVTLPLLMPLFISLSFSSS